MVEPRSWLADGLKSTIPQGSAPGAYSLVWAWRRPHSSTVYSSIVIRGYESMSFHDGFALLGGGPFAEGRDGRGDVSLSPTLA